ncbi:hypothetical protein NG799_27950, partial [Laspinema sp. D1]|nr:hypothetical protein [Laspinema sp. D2a]
RSLPHVRSNDFSRSLPHVRSNDFSRSLPHVRSNDFSRYPPLHQATGDYILTPKLYNHRPASLPRFISQPK